MSNQEKALFPACAMGGPGMLACGVIAKNGTPYGLLMSIPGAALTSAALWILFRAALRKG
jgi:hypothetical protein